MFAVDTTLIDAGLKSAFSIQKHFDAVSDLLAANKLTNNADVFFASGNPKPLKLIDTSLKFKLSCKYLGVHQDN